MEIRSSARKHGISDEDIRHAIRNAMFQDVRESDGGTQLLLIGPAHDGRLLEVVVTPAANPVKIIHADVLRPGLHYLILGKV